MNRHTNPRPEIVILYELATVLAHHDPAERDGPSREPGIARLEAALADTRRLHPATATSDTGKDRSFEPDGIA